MTEHTLTPSIGIAISNPRDAGQRAALGMGERARIDGKFFSLRGQRIRIQGVTYGPFAPNPRQEPFPAAERIADDFASMQAIGINAIRTYHVPPDWFLSLADEQGMMVFVDVPWPKHLCFLESESVQREARRLVREAARRGQHHPSVLAYSIGNEIPPNIVRWYGARRVERFLGELSDVAKQTDPHGLCTYASYPSTEYLDLTALDFATFNVYLHEVDTFRRYLMRLQNLVGDKPLLLGELGMDTLRLGEKHQADFLKGHVVETTLMGLAGHFVFSWTDEWFTGGFPIDNWAFGITYADRSPKASYHALRDAYENRPAELLQAPPRVSVVVCTYNGGRTLAQCLRSLQNLDYPDYEVIVVDDGSTDKTPDLLAEHGNIRVVRQPNNGLSAARNAGLRAATGAIIAYTDDDCFADVDWLTHLVHQFQLSDAAAVGGPNLTPDDGWLAACVAASPGQPTHVLESDQVAEHIPGCNMAFRREALEAINGFDPQYRKAGDDVDVCWRLQQAGYWITFAPGAFVWHHRRHHPRAYFRQQAGYGEAEALLRFKHPDRFNGRGDGKWRGVLYGASRQGLQLDDAIIYRGTFGTGLFQCLYQPVPAHWATYPSTLEWHLLIGVVLVLGLLWPAAWLVAGAMFGLSLAVAALQAVQARLPAPYQGFSSRLLVAGLCYFQPLVRSWSRYHTRLFSYRPPIADPAFPEDCRKHLPLSGTRTNMYWSEDGTERTALLASIIAYLNEHGWGKTIDSGWQDWDIEVYCHPWTVLQLCTSEEDHGGSRRLIRVRYRMRWRGITKTIGIAAFALAGIAGFLQAWSLVAVAGVSLLGCLGIWVRGAYRAAEAVTVVDGLARRMKLLACEPTSGGPPKTESPPLLKG
jgi:GT2 family glycosyltransferase